MMSHRIWLLFFLRLGPALAAVSIASASVTEQKNVIIIPVVVATALAATGFGILAFLQAEKLTRKQHGLSIFVSIAVFLTDGVIAATGIYVVLFANEKGSVLSYVLVACGCGLALLDLFGVAVVIARPFGPPEVNGADNTQEATATAGAV